MTKGSSWGHHGLQVKAFVTAPRRIAVHTDLGVGEVHVRLDLGERTAAKR